MFIRWFPRVRQSTGCCRGWRNRRGAENSRKRGIKIMIAVEIQREVKDRIREELNKITDKVIGIAIEIHKAIGPGFIEKVYGQALEQEFIKNKINFESQKQIKIKYKDIELGLQQVDFFVEKQVILEIKAVSQINNIHSA